MSDKKRPSIRTSKLIKALQVDDLKSLVKTLEEVQEKGNVDLIKPLIDLGKNIEEKEVQDAIQKILFSLKISAAHPVILEELKNIGPCSFRKTLLTTIWESNIDALPYLDTLVKIALEGDLYEAIEVLTILEESEGELIEERVLDSLLLLKEYEVNTKEQDATKEVFITSISDKLNDWNKGLD